MSVFGEEFENDWPVKDFQKQITPFGQDLLQKCLSIDKPQYEPINISEFIQKSNEFPIKFPIDSCRVKAQPVERHSIIQKQIASAYPLIHEKVLLLIIDFLEHKLKYGTSREKELYENMTVTDFVQRLLSKRCVTFVGIYDSYVLVTGEEGFGTDYLYVGTDEEEEPLTLKKVLSYDEIKIAALLSVTSHSEFINDGSRRNNGIPETDFSKIERNGVVIGVIGGRFVKQHRMEYEDILITKEQNIIEKGYGSEQDIPNESKVWQYLFGTKNTPRLEALRDYRKVWQKFYEEQDYLYAKVSRDDKRFGSCFKSDAIFDNVMMKKRYAISMDTLLLEANARALKANTYAYIHLVGFGLGVWLAAEHQEKIFIECFEQRLKYLKAKLNNVGVVHFSWFRLDEWGEMKNESILESSEHAKGGIKILISKRNPNEKLPAAYENMLPIVSYAWDANALPGNEFWMGSLNTSNDPSAASSTLITELFNPHINTWFINGNNLHLASQEYGIIHIKDYVEKILS